MEKFAVIITFQICPKFGQPEKVEKTWPRKIYFKTKLDFCLQAWLEFASEQLKFMLSTRDILKRGFWERQLVKAWNSRVWSLVDLRIDYIAIIITK